MKHIQLFSALIICLSLTLNAQNTYKGKPYNGKIPVIPGKIQCELYDLGGEGISFHDTDSANNGSGKLNPANGTFLNEFRMKEGVDISYTKTGAIDDNPYNFFNPEMEQLYVGWTTPGEWIKYTIDVRKTGKYMIGAMYTANGNGTISFSIDEGPVSATAFIPSTHRDDDTVAWRQWHHWNKLDSIAEINLTKGIHILKMAIVENGNMNFDFFELKYKY